MDLFTLTPPSAARLAVTLLLLLTTSSSSYTYACPDFCTCHDTYVTCTDFKTLDLAFLPPTADTLVLSMGEMEEVPPAFFARASNLKIVEIVNFNARVVRGGAFRGLNNLELLSITQSSFDIVEPDGFSGLNFISSIQISDCHFGRVGKHAFAEITNVDEWRIWASYFTSISDEAFYGLKEIHALQLYQNNISYIGHDIFAKSDNMDYINFYMNYIKTLSNGSLSRAMEVTERLVVYANTFECTCDNAWMREVEDFDIYLTTNECVFPGSLHVAESTFRLSDVSMTVLCPLVTPPTIPTDPTTLKAILHTMAPLFVQEVEDWPVIDSSDTDAYFEVTPEEGKLSEQNATHENASASSDELSFHSESSTSMSLQSSPLETSTDSSVVFSSSSLSPPSSSEISFVPFSLSSVDTHVEPVVDESLDKALISLSTEFSKHEIETASFGSKSEHPSPYLDQTTTSLLSPMTDDASQNFESSPKRVESTVPTTTYDDYEECSPDVESSSSPSSIPSSPPPPATSFSSSLSSSSTLSPPLSSSSSSLSPAQTSPPSPPQPQPLPTISSLPPQPPPPPSSIPSSTSSLDSTFSALSSSPIYLSDQSEQSSPISPTWYQQPMPANNSPSQSLTDTPITSNDESSYPSSFSSPKSPPKPYPTAEKESTSDYFTTTAATPTAPITDEVATSQEFETKTATQQPIQEISSEIMPTSSSVSDSAVRLSFEIQTSDKSVPSSLSESSSDSSQSPLFSTKSNDLSSSSLSSTSSSVIISTLISSSKSEPSVFSASVSESNDKRFSEELLSETSSLAESSPTSDYSFSTQPPLNPKSPESQYMPTEQMESDTENTEKEDSSQEFATARLAPVISQTKKQQQQVYPQAMGMDTTTKANDSSVSKSGSIFVTCMALLSLWLTVCR